ncbi:neuromedin-U [Pholidichthys leucotaenia]
MRTLWSQRQQQRGAFSRLHSSSSSAMSPLNASSTTLAALLILTLPVCQSAPADLEQFTADQRQLLSQIDTMCSSYLFTDWQPWRSDALGELCVLLVQKSKELKMKESSKRADFQGPGGIQSRGYFLYRPRNGRRSLEYE